MLAEQDHAPALERIASLIQALLALIAWIITLLFGTFAPNAPGYAPGISEESKVDPVHVPPPVDELEAELRP